jgi:serine/threonine-protein kinase
MSAAAMTMMPAHAAPARIELVDADVLIDRWTSWMADAAQGRLQAPSTMPERATPQNWRQK